jgi:hypothetical protein
MSPSETVMIDALVRESFDGVVGDELGPFDYFVSDAQRDNDQSAAVDIIADELRRRFARRLTLSEIVELVEYVGVEWQRRREKAEETNGMRAMARALRDGTDGGLSTSERTALKQSGRIR